MNSSVKLKLFLTAFAFLQSIAYITCSDFVAFSFGNEHNDLTLRQIQFANKKQIQLTVIKQSDSQPNVSKLDALRASLESMKDDKDTIILLVERGSLILNTSTEIKSVFQSMETRLLLSSAMLTKYPSFEGETEKVLKNQPEDEKQVDGCGVIAYADTLFAALAEDSLQSISGHRAYLKHLFSSSELRVKYQAAVDDQSKIFQKLDGLDELNLAFSEDGQGFLFNAVTNTFPAVVQPDTDDQKSIRSLNYLSNYLGSSSWHPVLGCQQCKKVSATHMKNVTENEYALTLVIDIHQPTPFLSEFLKRISNLSYNKSQIDIVISNTIENYESVIEGFVEESRPHYKSLQYIDSTVTKDLNDRILECIEKAQSHSSDYLFYIDSLAHLTNEGTIQQLMGYNKNLIAPLLSRRQKFWSNFWGAITDNNHYARSEDYLEIVQGNRRGVWNVPHVSNVYLVKKEFLSNVKSAWQSMKMDDKTDAATTFSGLLREEERFMFVANENDFGYLTNADQTTLKHLHNDLWEIFANPMDWEEKYIHEGYKGVAEKNMTLEDIAQPCPDVFWFPLVSETFSKQIIEEMEYFGQWSDGSNVDSRLEGGYESVPTRDIHMRQIDWEEHWLHVLKTYLYPMQLKLFEGYYDEPQARMNFIVRYKPSEQDRLRPHHDSASYTLNIALNKPGLDYMGGGARFSRYDCAVTESRVGWTLMHPGRITHLHEGLPTTNGTRYIFVTFVNP